MIRRLVEYFLGPLGMQVLTFYVEHSLAVNSVVVLYGLVLTLAHLNLRRIEAAAVRALRAETENQRGAGPKPSGRRGTASGPRDSEGGHPARADGAAIPWEAVIAQASFFPLVARGTSLVPRRTRAAALEVLCPTVDLLKKLEQHRSEPPSDREGSS